MKRLFLIFIASFSAEILYAQNYTSLADGSWTTPANWSNTSGWGSSTPGIASNHNSGTATVNHNLTISGNYALASATVNISSGKTLTVNGNLSNGGGSTINVSGTLIVNGNITLNSNLNILPGGRVIVQGSVTVVSSQYLTIGTGTAGPPYADLIIYQNLVSSTSGDVVVNQNGRLAVIGNITATGGGTFLTINNGGQTYVHGNINFSGGGSSINNNNATSPYGLYVNGTITNSGDGSSTTPNSGDKATMESTNPSFTTWLQNIPSSPLPIQLVSFKAEADSETVVIAWATESELNFDYFLIEHSLDGVTFSAIATVKGSPINTVGRSNYQHTHATPVSGKNYYRLKSVDKDGSFEYSRVAIVELNSGNEFIVFPNPASDRITLKLNFIPKEGDLIRILDSTGTVIQVIRPEEIDFTISIVDWNRGTYYVQLSGTTQKTLRVIIN